MTFSPSFSSKYPLLSPPEMWEAWDRSLGWEDPLEKGKAIHSSILAWRIPWSCKESDMTEWLSLSPQRNLKRLTLNTVSHATLDPEMEGIKILGHFWVSWYNWSTNGRMFSSVTQLCPTLCDPMDCSTPGSLSFTVSWSLLKLMFIESVMPSNHLILCHPLLLLPSIFPSIRVFSSESALHIRWPKYWSFSFSINPSNEYSGLISFRIDWFDLLAVQGTLNSLLQHHSSKV